jgi:hypothetical protein
MSDHRTFAAGIAISICYWRRNPDNDGSAASDRENATHAQVEGPGGYPTFTVERNLRFSSSPWYELDRLIQLLEHAFEAGKARKLKELRDFLGIKEAR